MEPSGRSSRSTSVGLQSQFHCTCLLRSSHEALVMPWLQRLLNCHLSAIAIRTFPTVNQYTRALEDLKCATKQEAQVNSTKPQCASTHQSRLEHNSQKMLCWPHPRLGEFIRSEYRIKSAIENTVGRDSRNQGEVGTRTNAEER